MLPAEKGLRLHDTALDRGAPTLRNMFFLSIEVTVETNVPERGGERALGTDRVVIPGREPFA